MNSHLIHKQVVEIQVIDKSEAPRAQDAVSQAFRHRWQEVINRVFNEFDTGGHIRLQRLEVDLELSDLPDGGHIEALKLEDALRDALKSASRKVVSGVKRTDSGVSALSAAHNSKLPLASNPGELPVDVSTAAIYYLKTGRLLWHQLTVANIRAWINEMIGTSAQESAVIEAIDPKVAHQLNRLVGLMSHASMSVIFQRIFSSQNLRAERMSQVIARSIEQWRPQLPLASAHRRRIDQIVIAHVVKTYLGVLRKEITATVDPAQMTGLIIAEILEHMELDDASAATHIVNNTLEQLQITTKKIDTQVIDNEIIEALHLPDQLKQSQQLDTPVFVQNAGAVILWPYLQPLFSAYGWVDAAAFTSDASQYLAVQMLHVLCTGDVAHDESNSTVGKLLCGLHPDDWIDVDVLLTQEQLAESEVLLTNVLKNWSALKSSSLDALRTGFLQRPGMIESSDQGWRITIERQGPDVLLDRLPWTISLIKLPWNDYFIQVDWT